jgi:Tetratricopeptide repeat
VRRYSLVTPVGDGAVSVHRLVQAVTADQLPADVASHWRQAAAALIEAAIPGDTRLPETWPACALLLPHSQSALSEDSPGMARLANYLGERGDFASAAELGRRVAGARERSLGPAHPDTLAARDSLAGWTGLAGDPAGARDQYAALLPVVDRVLGSQDPYTLHIWSSLARWTGEVGDAASARDQLAALLPVRERVLGAEHPDTLNARNHLASWSGRAIRDSE